MALITLENSTQGWTKRIPCNSVQPNYQRNNNAEPEQIDEPTDVTENTAENPTYSVQGWDLQANLSAKGTDGVFGIDDYLNLHYANDTLFLKVQFGTSQTEGGVRTLSPVQSGYTDKIPVTLQQAQFTISANDSERGYDPRGNLTFIETFVSNTAV